MYNGRIITATCQSQGSCDTVKGTWEYLGNLPFCNAWELYSWLTWCQQSGKYSPIPQSQIPNVFYTSAIWQKSQKRKNKKFFFLILCLAFTYFKVFYLCRVSLTNIYMSPEYSSSFHASPSSYFFFKSYIARNPKCSFLIQNQQVKD